MLLRARSARKTRFEPHWVLAHQPINRQFGVQITNSNPQFGDVQQRITLNKWWPGGSSTLHLPNADQWRRIEQIVNTQLGPKLGWTAHGVLVDGATDRDVQATAKKQALTKLASDYPSFLKDLAAAVDVQELSRKDFDGIVETFGEISSALTHANAGFRQVFLSIVKKLPSQSKERSKT